MKHNIVKNHGTGTMSESFKPTNPVDDTLRGTLKVEVFNNDGSLDQEATVTNVIFDSYFKQHAMDYVNSTCTHAAKSLGVAPKENLGMTSYLALTSWDKPENPANLTVLGERVTYANSALSSSTSVGYLNEPRSGITADSTGTPVRRMTWDWVPDAGNGTFQSLWLCNSSYAFNPVPITSSMDYRSTGPRWATSRGERDYLLEAVFWRNFSSGITSGSSLPTTSGGAAQSTSLTQRGNTLTSVVFPDSKLPSHANKLTKVSLDMDTGVLSTPVTLTDYDGKPVPYRTSDMSGYGPYRYSAGVNVGLSHRYLCASNGVTYGVAIDPNSSSSLGFTANTIKIIKFGQDGMPVSDMLISLADTKLQDGRVFVLTDSHIMDAGAAIVPHTNASGVSDTVVHILGSFATSLGSTSNATAGHLTIDLEQGRILAVEDDGDKGLLDNNVSNDSSGGYTRFMCYSAASTSVLPGGVYSTYVSGNSGIARYGSNLIYIDNTYKLHRLGSVVSRVTESSISSSTGSASDSLHPNGSMYHRRLVRTELNGTHTYRVDASPSLPQPTSHSLLPAPVTKNDTQSMRITYDVYYESPDDVLDIDGFTKYIAESF